MNTFSVAKYDDTVQPSHCYINTSKGIYNIPLSEILFIECYQKKSLAHMKRETLILPIPLYRLKEALPAALFLQTHRSFLVNLQNVSHIDKQKDPWTVFFFDSQECAYISRSFRRQVMEAVSD
ncbi:MAG: LytTR family transcriptional regulator [Anaerotignum sp.]|nr:LytTR family transcriptional regulator [Anaerotignum sp.]